MYLQREKVKYFQITNDRDMFECTYLVDNGTSCPLADGVENGSSRV